MLLPSNVDTAARRRETALWQGAGASVVAKGVSALCQLAQVPVAMGYLGTELFGLWMTLVSALAMMAFADLGIGAGVQNEAAALVGKDRTDEARKTCVNGLAVLGLVGVGLVTILSVGCVWLPWAGWIGVADTAMAEEARRGLLILIVLFCANLPLTALARLAYGLQLGWLANAWYAAINLLTLVAVMAASGWRMGFAGFVMVAAVPPVVGHIALGIHLFIKMHWRMRGLPLPDTTGMKRLLKAGLPFTLPQLGGLALVAVPPVLISATLGPAMVTPWNMGQRLLGLFGQLQGMLLAPLWPAFAEARSRGDEGWLKKNYRRSVILSGVAVALPQLLFALWGGAAIDLWSHGAVSLDWPTAAAFGFWAAVSSMSQPPAFLLNSFGRALGQGIYGGVSVAIIIACAPMVLRTSGLAGLAALAGIIFGVINLPFVYGEARLVLHRGVTARLVSPKYFMTWICRLMRYVRRTRVERRIPVVIYKVDRLGDFVLALGALRFVVARAGTGNVLMILSDGVRTLAEREFPRVEKYFVRYDGEGGRAALRAAWSNPLARGIVHADSLICLRHQDGLFRAQLLAGLGADISIGCAEGGEANKHSEDFSKTIFYPDAKSGEMPVELRTHAAVLASWSGEPVAAVDLLPVLIATEPAEDFVLICPFGSSEVRDYPVERWAEIVRGLQAAGRRVFFNAAAGDRTRIHELAKQCGVADVEVTADFSAYFVLIARAAVVVTVETAAAHLATALDKTAVVLIGGGHFGKCGPWTRSARQVWLTHEMECFGCNWSCVHEEPWCVRRIAAEHVVAAVAALPTPVRAV